MTNNIGCDAFNEIVYKIYDYLNDGESDKSAELGNDMFSYYNQMLKSIAKNNVCKSAKDVKSTVIQLTAKEFARLVISTIVKDKTAQNRFTPGMLVIMKVPSPALISAVEEGLAREMENFIEAHQDVFATE